MIDISPRKELEQRLQDRVAEVEQLNRTLTTLLADLQTTNRDLETMTTQLREANEELEAFAYSVSHDLRAPLRAMQGFAQALLEDYAGHLDPVGQDYAQRIVKAAQRMDALIQDLLAYSRLSRTQVTPQPIPLSAAVSEVLRYLEEECQQREARVTVTEPLPLVQGYQPILIQVLSNLLSNALKYVPTGKRPFIRIRAEERDTWIRLWVEDNGIGIAPEHQARIFRIFERLHDAETYPGTGIGLAIVRKGIERLGGRVGVESVPDEGSRFWIELPKGS
ncbi:MAG: hypothetical protein D6736_16110 [Nitrospinota bacterium]|nr:MAG: hypothetical protein D6736_16110 [Nitrospinota bacterium]